MAILTYGTRAAKKLGKRKPKRTPSQHAHKIERLLEVLDRASSLNDLRRPGARLHKLRGDRQDFYAIDVSARLRIVFRFEGGNAYDVEVVDYHRS